MMPSLALAERYLSSTLSGGHCSLYTCRAVTDRCAPLFLGGAPHVLEKNNPPNLPNPHNPHVQAKAACAPNALTLSATCDRRLKTHHSMVTTLLQNPNVSLDPVAFRCS